MEPAHTTYQCPGEPYRISRSVHLGRLANFYPKCRDCPYREDTGPLSSKTVRQLQRAQQCQPPASVFVNDGVRGVYLNDLDRGTAKELGDAFGRFLASETPAARRPEASRSGEADANGSTPASPQAFQWEAAGLRRRTGPVAVVGHDDRLSSPDLATGLIEGLRAAGCQVVSIGCAAGACLRYAVRYLEADGGALVTGGAARPHVNGMHFYARDALPLTRDHGLSEIARLRAQPAVPPRRRAVPLSHFHAQLPYHAGLLKFFHALRPLRIQVREATASLRRSLERLLRETPCTAVWTRPGGGHDDRVETTPVDLGVAVDGDDCVAFFDERNHPVPADQACRILGKGCLRVHPGAALVLEEPAPHHLSAAFEAAGARVHGCEPDAADVYLRMQEHDAVYAVDGFTDGLHRLHYWFHDNGPVLDPVRALAAMLAELSLSDRPLSAVLAEFDAAAAP